MTVTSLLVDSYDCVCCMWLYNSK